MTDSDTSMNLSRGDADWGTDLQPALALNWMEQVLDQANVLQAWGRVKSNKGAPGSDGMSLEDFPSYARDQWPSICQSLMDGTYRPLEYIGCWMDPAALMLSSWEYLRHSVPKA